MPVVATSALAPTVSFTATAAATTTTTATALGCSEAPERRPGQKREEQFPPVQHLNDLPSSAGNDAWQEAFAAVRVATPEARDSGACLPRGSLGECISVETTGKPDA